MERETDQESEEAAEGETEKNESDGKRKERTSGGIASILIPTPLLN